MSDFIRFDTNPTKYAPPKGKIDLFYDTTTGGLASRDSTGIHPVISATTTVNTLTLNPSTATIDDVMNVLSTLINTLKTRAVI